MIQLSVRQRRVLVWVGYPLLALVTLVFAVAHTFPYERLDGKISDFFAEKYEVHIESIESTFLPGGVVIRGMEMTTRPKKPEEKPVTVYIDELRLSVGLLSLITGDVELDVEAAIGDGILDGEIAYSSKGLEARLEAEDIPLDQVPGVAGSIGLPMGGDISMTFELELPKIKWRDAEGEIQFECVGCTVGDGKTKLKMKPQGKSKRARQRAAVFAGDGVTVPRLRLGDASAHVTIRKGVGTIDKLAAKSKDGTLNIDGKVEFRDPFKTTRFPGCMRFTLSDDLKKREPDFGNIEFMLPPKARQPDGQFAIPTKGTLMELRWDPRRRCRGLPSEKGEGARTRPEIAVRPEKEAGDAKDVKGTVGENEHDADGDDKVRRAGNQPNNPESETDPVAPRARMGLPDLGKLKKAADDVRRPGDDAGPGGDDQEEDGDDDGKDEKDDDRDTDEGSDDDREGDDDGDEETQEGAPR